MKKLRIGLAGLGTVGKGVYEILRKDAAMLSKRSDTIFEITAVAARTKKDFVDAQIKFYDNSVDLADDQNVDVVVEVMGGLTVAKELIEKAIKNGKKVVTANKALIAEHGSELIDLIEKYNGQIAFEASTAGANPVIKTFRESFISSEVTEFYAILNGTCNFILTKMRDEELDYHTTLVQAQKFGYAEADPTLDVKGIDTAHKLAILSSISSMTKPNFKKLHIEGVDQVTIEDIKFANDFGFKIKLLAIYKNLGNAMQQSVYPALIPANEKIAQVDGPFNAVLVNTTNASYNFSVGRGAGGLTTGSAVVADLLDIANERSAYFFGAPNSQLSEANIINLDERCGKYFLRLTINKEVAQKTDLAAQIFADKIKINQAAFVDHDNDILCAFLTDSQKEKEVIEILNNVDKTLVKSVKFLRVEETHF